MTRRDGQAGVTLVEMLVALMLLALIGVAGLSVLEQVLRAQERTGGRLERLGQMQRSMHLLTLDFATAAPASLSAPEGAGTVSLARQGLGVDYALTDGTLWRSVASADGQPLARQALFRDLVAGEWRFLSEARAWTPRWPPADAPASLGAAANPRAVELRLAFSDGSALRRVALLPAAAP